MLTMKRKSEKRKNAKRKNAMPQEYKGPLLSYSWSQGNSKNWLRMTRPEARVAQAGGNQETVQCGEAASRWQRSADVWE